MDQRMGQFSPLEVEGMEAENQPFVGKRRSFLDVTTPEV